MSSKILKINRGDSFSFTVRVPDAENYEKNYLLTADDILYFALLYPHQRFEDAILLKGCTNGDRDINEKTGEVTVKLTPNDTRELTPGIYYYTVKLQRGGTPGLLGGYDEPEEVRTIIERTKFIINE